VASLVGALALALAVLQVSVAGAGTIPPLGSAINPGTGVWITAGQGDPPRPGQPQPAPTLGVDDVVLRGALHEY
jgi:hypothetical protein